MLQSHALPHHPVQVDEHPEPEQVVHLVLTRGKTPHQSAHRLLARPVEFGEMVHRRRLVMVVVVNVQPRVPFAPLGPVIGPDLRVPGESRLAGLGHVHDAEQVLQPELPAVLGVIPRSLDIEEQVPVRRFRQPQQPRGWRPARRRRPVRDPAARTG